MAQRLKPEVQQTDSTANRCGVSVERLLTRAGVDPFPQCLQLGEGRPLLLRGRRHLVLRDPQREIGNARFAGHHQLTADEPVAVEHEAEAPLGCLAAAMTLDAIGLQNGLCLLGGRIGPGNGIGRVGGAKSGPTAQAESPAREKAAPAASMATWPKLLIELRFPPAFGWRTRPPRIP